MEGVSPIRLTVSHFPAYFKTQVRPPCRLLVPIASAFRFKERSLPHFAGVLDYRFYRLHNTRQMITLEETWFIHEIKERMVGLC